MWFVIKLIVVSFISTFALFGALGSDNEWPGLIVSGTVWTLFVWSCMGKGEKSSEKEKERRINEMLREIDRRYQR
jgi:hypothetical protein